MPQDEIAKVEPWPEAVPEQSVVGSTGATICPLVEWFPKGRGRLLGRIQSARLVDGPGERKSPGLAGAWGKQIFPPASGETAIRFDGVYE